MLVLPANILHAYVLCARLVAALDENLVETMSRSKGHEVRNTCFNEPQLLQIAHTGKIATVREKAPQITWTLGTRGSNCAQTCAANEKVCQDTGWAMSPSEKAVALKIFQAAGVKCDNMIALKSHDPWSEYNLWYDNATLGDETVCAYSTG